MAAPFIFTFHLHRLLTGSPSAPAPRSRANLLLGSQNTLDCKRFQTNFSR